MGAVFSRKISYVAGEFMETKARFRSEFDLVAKAQIGIDGRWLVVGGIELDPTRFFQDFGALFP